MWPENSKLTGIESRGTGSTSVGSDRIASTPVTPAGYENIVNTGHVIGLEAAHVLMPSSAKKFIARARAKHEFLINHSDNLLAVSQLDLLEAQSRIAGTLLNMKIELERRLNDPFGLSQFIGVAWSRTDPLAGLVEYAYPFSHSDRWQEYVDRFQKAWYREKRRRRRLRRKKSISEPEAKVVEPVNVNIEEIKERIRGRGIQDKGLGGDIGTFVEDSKKRSKERESNLPSQIGLGVDAFLALAGETLAANAANAALAAGLVAPIISVGFYFISLGQGVKQQHRNAFVSGTRRGASNWLDSLGLIQIKQEGGRHKSVSKVQFNGEDALIREEILCGTNPNPKYCWLSSNLPTSSWPASSYKILAIRKKYFLIAFEQMNIEVTKFERAFRDKLRVPLWKELQKNPYKWNDFNGILDRVYREHVGAARLKHMTNVVKVIRDEVQ